jgi:hypothetical protein
VVLNDRDSVVVIANRHGLDGPAFEPWWGGARFSTPDQFGPDARPDSYRVSTGSLSLR